MQTGERDGVQHGGHLLLLQRASDHLLHHHRGQVRHRDRLHLLHQVLCRVKEAVLFSERRDLHGRAIAAMPHCFKAGVHHGEGEAVQHRVQEVLQDSAGEGLLGLLQVWPA